MVSTEKQVEKYSIPSQLSELKERCQKESLTPISDLDKDAFIDDGYSGADMDRPALNRLRKAVKEGRVDVVLIYDPDRLSRSLFHLLILADEIEKRGVKLEFITQEMGNTAEGRMLFNLRGIVAEYEREKIKERTIRGSREKAKQGKLLNPRNVPYGFRYNAEKNNSGRRIHQGQDAEAPMAGPNKALWAEARCRPHPRSLDCSCHHHDPTTQW